MLHIHQSFRQPSAHNLAVNGDEAQRETNDTPHDITFIKFVGFPNEAE